MNTAKRKDGESFAVYKQRRKAEALELKRKLAGRMVWASCPRLSGLSDPDNMPSAKGRTYRREAR